MRNVLAQQGQQMSGGSQGHAPRNVLAMMGQGQQGGAMPNAQQGGMMGQPFPLRAPDPQMPSQQDIDALWAQQPTDQNGAMIEHMIQRSGGTLQAPWERTQPQGAR